MLCGLTHPTAGNATIEGADVWKDRQLVRTKFGYVPQRFSLYRDFTVLENFRFFGGAYGVPGAELEQRIKRLLRVTTSKKIDHDRGKPVWRHASAAGDRMRARARSVAAFF